MNVFESEFGETGYEFGELEFGETGYELGELEFGETGYELESTGGAFEYESVLNEAQEVQLASELLEISNEQELEQFLGNIFKGVSKAVGGIVKNPVFKSIGGVLKGVAKKALPMVGGALGNMFLPGVGGMLGNKLGSMAGSLFELELGEMSQEQAEFEVARKFVNLTAGAAKNAATAPPSANPQAVAKAALLTAARTHAPGLARALSTGGGLATTASSGCRPGSAGSASAQIARGALSGPRAGGIVGGSFGPGSTAFAGGTTAFGTGQNGGRWVRRGNKILVVGV